MVIDTSRVEQRGNRQTQAVWPIEMQPCAFYMGARDRNNSTKRCFSSLVAVLGVRALGFAGESTGWEQ